MEQNPKRYRLCKKIPGSKHKEYASKLLVRIVEETPQPCWLLLLTLVASQHLNNRPYFCRYHMLQGNPAGTVLDMSSLWNASHRIWIYRWSCQKRRTINLYSYPAMKPVNHNDWIGKYSHCYDSETFILGLTNSYGIEFKVCSIGSLCMYGIVNQ